MLSAPELENFSEAQTLSSGFSKQVLFSHYWNELHVFIQHTARSCPPPINLQQRRQPNEDPLHSR